MRKLVKPNFKVEDVLNCAEKKNETLRSHKSEIVSALTDVEREYEERMTREEILQIQQGCRSVLSSDEMRKMYKSLGRYHVGKDNLRNMLLFLADYTKCPYCGHNMVSQLDHYLPKELYSDLAIVPLNLVPACPNCNQYSKNRIVPASNQDYFIHPYFDDPNDVQWLRADVRFEDRLTVTYSVTEQRPESWSDSKYGRVKYTFVKLRLAEMYAKDFVHNIHERRDALKRTFEQADGAAKLQVFFARQSELTLPNKNDWIGLAYSNLGSNRDVCEHFNDWFPANPCK